MQRTLLFFLATCVLQAAAADLTRHAKVSIKESKRALMTCEETYGSGSVPCGNSSSTLCYNPAIGQVCCPLDNGYCDQGTYCAPVAGFCCLETEDDAACAENAGFALPASSILAGAPTVIPFLTASVVEVSEVSTATEVATAIETEVTLFPATQTQSEVTLFPVTQTTVTIPLSTGPGPSTNTSANVSATYIPSVVQVSVARTEQRTLIWTSLGIVAVALFMSSC